MPHGPRINDVKVVTSGAPAIDQRRRALEGLADDGNYVLRARVAEGRGRGAGIHQ